MQHLLLLGLPPRKDTMLADHRVAPSEVAPAISDWEKHQTGRDRREKTQGEGAAQLTLLAAQQEVQQ